jgi:hypothetical protein
MVDTEAVGLVLWIVAGTLMAAGVIGIALALLLERGAVDESAHEVRPAPVREVRTVVAAEEAPVEPVEEEVLPGRKRAYRDGAVVLFGLAVLTAAEFWVASALAGSAAFLFVIALVKAGVIIQYYMHLNHVWGGEETHS